MEMSTWTVGLAAVLLFMAYCWRKATYWSSRGVPSFPVTGAHYTVLRMILKKDKQMWIYMNEGYQKHKRNGFMGGYELNLTPTGNVYDPELVKRVMIQDFDHFPDRRHFNLTNKDDYMREMLSMVNGSHWKGIRSVMSPTFTSGKMRQMFPLVAEKAEVLVQYLRRQCHEEPFLKMKSIYGRYIMDVIATCAFGIDCNAITNEDEEFSKRATEMNALTARAVMRFLAIMALPKAVLSVLGISLTTPPVLFFRDVVIETIKLREKGKKRGDFLDLMLEQREQQENPDAKTPKYPMKDVTIIAQSILFLIAGHETTANTMSFISFHLARHPDIQRRLRQELRDCVDEHGSLKYQVVMEAPFLDACFSETLRLHPPAVATERECVKDYILPGTSTVIKKGQRVAIPIWCFQNDPDYWSTPEQFIPDRFMPENKHKVVSGTYLPFGLGPRNCIGMRFALMEAKLALAKVVLEFEMSPAPGHEEIEYSVMAMKPKDNIYIVLKPLEDNKQVL